ncbi:conserved hypothetical protein [Fictibacillus enclensis]|uniref:Methionyl-tRNA formyltransferase n=1 Tax=Fictibacillus enclensis TaxID=1017270 RepID=A0A0V8JCA7_9BACL|nr:SgcJ/EcaC family oxidoreductase [Fictibacillus enclensis]KSU84601.1 methionyl-tRNA formyltransferase [Fictibacillus enclensis]SCB82195.1 conserved hypothetical protein [Fictibacillus enclensis]
MNSSNLQDIIKLYRTLISSWNNRDAVEMAAQFLKDGEMIGFDGSQIIGREDIRTHLSPIFNDHPTPPFTCKVKAIKLLSENSALLRAIAGMVPHGEKALNPALNAHQTLIAVKKDNTWKIQLFQNTPAQFHGRPDLVEQMTEELRHSPSIL